MVKVKITADIVLGIIKSVLADSDIDIIDDPNAPAELKGKTLSEILNVDYYTFKYRPESTEQAIASLRRERESTGDYSIDTLTALKRGFCCFVLGDVIREFANDIDIASCEGVLDYWVQTDKIKLLELLIEKANIALNGKRIPVDFPNGEVRKAFIIFAKPEIQETISEDLIGEAIRCSVQFTAGFTPDAITYDDYKVEISVSTEEQNINGQTEIVPVFVTLPVNSITFDTQMTQKGVPFATDTRRTGTINLSRGRTLKLNFIGYNSYFVNWLANNTIAGETEDNNKLLLVRLTRNNISTLLQMVIAAHAINISNTIENEIHSLTLLERGI